MEHKQIAVIGMAGRFPGARNIDAFWKNVKEGVESISFFDEAERHPSIDPAILESPNLVKAGSLLEDADCFDAALFGISAREAELMDAQHRLFLECAWAALEDAGYDSERSRQRIGVYAGAGPNLALLGIASGGRIVQQGGTESIVGVLIGNTNDYLTTRASFKLNLHGPSIDVQSACSTSLVAVHLACQALAADDCDIALAGGVSVKVPQKTGHIYEEGGIFSHDGHCRSFDAKANGTIFGSGVGIVVLKRLKDAIRDRDNISAIVRATAINNDGSLKFGYTAPSAQGQADVISTAVGRAGIDVTTIGYVEAHGTGTAIGDPIEVAALTKAFRHYTKRKQFCGIGSVKANVGHLDAAAGVAGLIKAVLTLKHGVIPPLVHFSLANKEIDFANSPFFPVERLTEWANHLRPRRAGVNAFGIGGTNAHVVLEEAPNRGKEDEGRPVELLVLSAKTKAALGQMSADLVAHLGSRPKQTLSEIAYTLQVGRRRLPHRRYVVCRNITEAIRKLEENESTVLSRSNERDRSVAFMFPGQGSQRPRMFIECYENEPHFRDIVSKCSAVLAPVLGCNLAETIYGQSNDSLLNKTYMAQPALFVCEYALAQLWMSWGVQPQAMIGHSVGEYVAACLAGVFDLEVALLLMAARGRLMEALPTGAMLAVSRTEGETRELLVDGLSLAAINGPTQCVVSGSIQAIERLEANLADQLIPSHRLRATKAFHSRDTEEILVEYYREITKYRLGKPQIRFASNVTGKWITDDECVDPTYWVQHLRAPVRFFEGLSTLLEDAEPMLLEVGPGQVLASLARSISTRSSPKQILRSSAHEAAGTSDYHEILNSLGQLWAAGWDLNWHNDASKVRRVSLPTYPFERKQYPVKFEAGRPNTGAGSSTGKQKEPKNWLYTPLWKETRIPAEAMRPEKSSEQYLVLCDSGGFGVALARCLDARGHRTATVEVSKKHFGANGDHYAMDPDDEEQYRTLFNVLRSKGPLPTKIIDAFNVASNLGKASDGQGGGPVSAKIIRVLRLSRADRKGGLERDFQATSAFYRGVSLIKALAVDAPEIELTFLTTGVVDVDGSEDLQPENATLRAIGLVAPQELGHIKCKIIDLPNKALDSRSLMESVIREVESGRGEKLVAYRGSHRWVEHFEPVEKRTEGVPPCLTSNGVYLITGGLGNIGLALARHVSKQDRVKLVLVSRSGVPAHREWTSTLADSHTDETIERRIRALQEIEAQGAEVLTMNGDVSDTARMTEIVREAYRRFGRIDVVIHAAGTIAADSFRSLVDLSRSDCDRHFQPKIRGLIALRECLPEPAPKVWIVLSSLSSILGGLGMGAYAAANSFMDLFVRSQSNRDERWISLNFDAWTWSGRPGGHDVSPGLAKFAMNPEEGIEAFDHAISSGSLRQVVVSTGDLQARIQRWTSREMISSALIGKHNPMQSVRSNPTLEESSTSTRQTLQARVAEVWCEFLGLEKVAPHDDFFDLGGDSLIATQVVAHLRQIFGVTLALREVVEANTVSKLSELIEVALTREVENLTEEEAALQMSRS